LYACIFFKLFKYFDWIEILPEEEDGDVITTSSVRAELELNDKNCVEYLNDLLKKFNFNKHKNIQKMTAQEMITFDDHLDDYQR
jgi:hypothetical protein